MVANECPVLDRQGALPLVLSDEAILESISVEDIGDPRILGECSADEFPESILAASSHTLSN